MRVGDQLCLKRVDKASTPTDPTSRRSVCSCGPRLPAGDHRHSRQRNVAVLDCAGFASFDPAMAPEPDEHAESDHRTLRGAPCLRHRGRRGGRSPGVDASLVATDLVQGPAAGEWRRVEVDELPPNSDQLDLHPFSVDRPDGWLSRRG